MKLWFPTNDNSVVFAIVQICSKSLLVVWVWTVTLEKTLLLVSVPRKNTGREDNKYLKARVAYIACHHSTAWFAVGESFAIFSARLREYSDFERIATRDCVTAACANYVHQRDNWAPTYLVSKRLVRIRRCLLNCHIWVTCIYIFAYCFHLRDKAIFQLDTKGNWLVNWL